MLKTFRTLLILTLASTALFLNSGAVLATSLCDGALDLDSTALHQGFGTTETLRLDLPETGLLTVDLIDLHGLKDAAARLEILPGACGETPADILYVERSPARLVLAVRTPGALGLRVATKASRFEVVTGFAPARIVTEDLDLDGLPARQTSFLARQLDTKGEPEDVDPDADGLASGGGRLLALFLTVEISLVRKGDPEDVDPDADGLLTRATSGSH